MKKIFALTALLLISLQAFSQGTAATLPCGVSSAQSLGSNGFSGDDPTTATGSCGQCCYAGSDLDGDGDQDVSFSVENSDWFRYCNSTGSPITIDFIVDETNNDCNLQGAVFVGGTNPNGGTDALDIDCSNQEFSEFGSNVSGNADGFSFTGVTIPAGGCAYLMVDGYAGQICGGFTVNTVCPPACTNPTSFTAGSDQLICEGSSVTLNSTVTGGLTSGTGLTYSWTPTTGLSCTTCADPVASPTSTTTYTMTACNGGTFCCVTDQVTVTVTPNFVANAGPDVTACAGSTVSIGGTPTGPSGSTYSWVETGANANIGITGSSTVANPNVTIGAGATGSATYTVTVTNGACVRTDIVIVTVGTLAVNAGTDQSICAGSSFNIGGNPTAPAGSTYSWVCAGAGCVNLSLSSSTTANPTVTTTTAVTGSVTFTVTATLSGCSNTDAVTITFNALPATPSATASTNPICAGQSVTLTAAGGSGSGTYSWWTASTGGTNLGSANTLVVAPTATTTYYLQSTDATTGCISLRGSITITVNSTPVANAGANQTLCAGEAVVLAGTVTNPAGCSPVQTWTVISGTGTFSPNANTLNATFTPTSTGTIQLRLTPCTSGGCTAVSDDVILTVAPSPSVTVSAISNPICQGLINDLNGVVTGGTPTPDDTLFQSFSSNAVTTNIPDNTAAGVLIPISVSGISNATLGSTFVSSTEVNVDHNRIGQVEVWLCPPGVTPTSPTFPGCVQLFNNHGANGDDMINTLFTDLSTTDIAIGATPYTGSFNPTGSNTLASLSGQPTNGTWNLVVIDNVNNPNETGTAGQWDITFGTPIAQQPYTYSWTPTTALSTPNDVSTSLFTSGFIAPTTVTYTLTATDFNGCEGSDAIDIDIIDVPVVDAGTTQNLCVSNATLAGTALSSGETGLWTVISGSATFTNDASPTTTVTALGSGNNILQWTVTNSCGVTSDQVQINVSPATNASISVSGSSTICSGSSASLVFTLTGTGNYNVVYSNGTSNFNLNNINNGHTITVSPTTTTTYTLISVFDNGSGCTGTASGNVTITVNPLATVNAGSDQTICSGSTVTLAGIVGGGASTGTWTGGTGTFNPNNTTLNAVYSPSAAEISANTVTLTLTTNDPAGPCGAVADQMTITINTAATANANSDQTICAGSTVTLAGSIGGGASSATWTSSSGTYTPNATTLNATFTPSAAQVTAGTATLTLTTNDPAGICTAASDVMIITINPVATVDAGSNQSACAGTVFNISGTIGGAATSSTWSTSGSGTFGSMTSLATTYTPSAADISTGSITLTLTTNDPTGPCGLVSDFITITITPLQSAAFSYSNGTFCQTGTNPSPTVTGAGSGTFTSSPAGLSINASTGAINLAASSLNTYNITYTTPGPCPSSSSVSITITSAPSASFSYAGPYCQSGSDPLPTFGGGASAGTFSSTAGLVFVSTSTGQVDLSASTPGNYTVQNDIIASGGCSSATATNTITIDDDATVSASGDQTICTGSTVTLSGSIGSSASSGTWTGGGTFTPTTGTLNATYTPSASELSAGTATLTLTTNDPPGACAAVNDQMIITINPVATVDASSNQTICAGSTVTLAGSVGGASTSATWSGGTGGYSPGTGTLNAVYTPSAGDISSGSVILTLTSDDPSGPCNAVTDQMTITINTPVTIDAGSNTSVCSGSTVTLSGSISGGTTTGTWSGGTGSFNPNNTTLNAVYTPSSAEMTAGSFTLTLTSSDPTGPCNANSDVVTITLETPATVDAGNDVTVCEGSNATYSGNFGGGASSITWTTSGNGTFVNENGTVSDYIPSASDITAGSVILTITTNDPAGSCTAVSDFMNVTITPSEDASFNYSNADFCLNGSNETPTITGVTGGSFFANAGLNLVSNSTGEIAVNASTPGTYYVYYLTNGTCFGLDSFEVTINGLPNVDAGTDQTITCSSNSVNLTGSSTTLNAQFSWTGPSIVSGNNTATAAVDASGTYTLEVTDPSTGCSVTDDVSVIPDSSIPTISAGSNQEITCSVTEVTLIGSTPNANLSYLWSGPGLTGANDTLITTADAAGTYTLFVTDTTNGCSNTASVDVILNNSVPALNAGTDTLITCTTTSLVLNATSSQTNDIEFIWSGPGIVSGGNSLNVTIDATGTYILTATDTLTGCTSSDTIVISFDNSAFITSISDDTTLCEGESATLIATGGAAYEWSDGSTGNSLTVSPTSTTPYYVLITEGICFDSLVVNVNVNPSPNIVATASPGTIFEGESSQLNATGGLIYTWSPSSSLTCTNCSNPVATPLLTTTYIVSSVDANGCTGQATVTVTLDVACPEIFLPSAFSPNGSSLNDAWCIEGNTCIESMDLKLYDRWGTLVYESIDATSCWDGTFEGKEFNNGVFYYVFEATLINDETVSLKGNVTIIK